MIHFSSPFPVPAFFFSKKWQKESWNSIHPLPPLFQVYKHNLSSSPKKKRRMFLSPNIHFPPPNKTENYLSDLGTFSPTSWKMNPLLPSPSLSELSISVTNIRSLGLTTKNLTHKKFNSILDLKNSVNILVDSKVSEIEADQICNNDFKYLLRDYIYADSRHTNKN